MKPAPFEYHRPESVEEAIGLLAKGPTSASWPAARASCR